MFFVQNSHERGLIAKRYPTLKPLSLYGLTERNLKNCATLEEKLEMKLFQFATTRQLLRESHRLVLTGCFYSEWVHEAKYWICLIAKFYNICGQFNVNSQHSDIYSKDLGLPSFEVVVMSGWGISNKSHTKLKLEIPNAVQTLSQQCIFFKPDGLFDAIATPINVQYWKEDSDTFQLLNIKCPVESYSCFIHMSDCVDVQQGKHLFIATIHLIFKKLGNQICSENNSTIQSLKSQALSSSQSQHTATHVYTSLWNKHYTDHFNILLFIDLIIVPLFQGKLSNKRTILIRSPLDVSVLFIKEILLARHIDIETIWKNRIYNQNVKETGVNYKISHESTIILPESLSSILSLSSIFMRHLETILNIIISQINSCKVHRGHKRTRNASSKNIQTNCYSGLYNPCSGNIAEFNMEVIEIIEKIISLMKSETSINNDIDNVIHHNIDDPQISPQDLLFKYALNNPKLKSTTNSSSLVVLPYIIRLLYRQIEIFLLYTPNLILLYICLNSFKFHCITRENSMGNEVNSQHDLYKLIHYVCNTYSVHTKYADIAGKLDMNTTLISVQVDQGMIISKLNQ